MDRLGEAASKGTIGKELRDLVEKRILQRVGRGKKNNPYRYFHPHDSFSQPIYRAWEKESSNGTGGHLVRAALEMGAEIVSMREDPKTQGEGDHS